METYKIRKISIAKIDEIFAKATKQSEYWLELYRLAFPDWDNIEKLHGFPIVSLKTGEYIMGKAIEWDKAHPEMRGQNGLKVMSGGLWMDKGFSSREYVADDEIDISKVKIDYK